MRIFLSLTNRIFLACTLLVTLALSLAFGYLYWRTSRDAETDLVRELDESEMLVGEYQASLTDTFGRMARLVADLPKLKAAVATNDPPTVQPLADDYRHQIAADVLVLSGSRGALLATSGVSLSAMPAELPERPAGTSSERASYWLSPGGLLEITSVPIALDGEPPEILGRMTVGFLLDQARAEQLKRLTGSEIVFVAGHRVVASTLPRNDVNGLVAPAGTSLTLRAGPEEFVGRARPLTLRQGTADAFAPSVLILRSRTQRLRLLGTIRSGLAGALIVAMLCATLLSYLAARSTTRPLNAVTTVMRDMAATGDLTRKVHLADTGWQDEDARLLAATFNTLTDSITVFQREAAQRERLSSLGRLSTVIAHEIRNPLMIIKAALRSLRRADATDGERHDAIVDIDEETGRLNRIVTDVLDFARPMHFETGAVDLNRLCTDSVQAAWVDASDARIELDLQENLPPIVTDAERMRTALVNVLTNARHAVAAAQAAAPRPRDEGADLHLSTRARDGHAVITIRDRGIGITPEDMEHIFDPYFTTRRAGTGLGLPIARNIVEGLGGQINVASTPGHGTELRIALPANDTARWA